MHYYSFADGPAWSSIVNFISRLNVPNSNAASRYFSLTRTLFTALSPIKSGPDTNVKAKPLSRCAYSHYHPSPTTATIAELNDARQTVACLTYGGERWGGKNRRREEGETSFHSSLHFRQLSAGPNNGPASVSFG